MQSASRGSEPPTSGPTPLGPLPRIATTTLVLAILAATAWALLPLFFVPSATTQWLRAIRGAYGDEKRLGSGLSLLALAILPAACTASALAALAWGEPAAPSRALAALALVAVLAAPFGRLPLVLVDAPAGQPLGRTLRDALVIAGADPLGSLVLGAAQAAATGAAFALGRALLDVRGLQALVALALALAALPLASTPVVMIASRATPRAAPPVRMTTLVAMGSFLFAGLAALVAAGALATIDPLPLDVVEDGRGVQRYRGLRPEDRSRGGLETARFTVSARLERLYVQPRDGEAYEVEAAYDPALALISAAPEGPDVLRLQLEGPDWRMQVRVDASGRRVDDGPARRALVRIGRGGSAALIIGLVAVLSTGVVLVRVAVGARMRTGAGLAHRLRGRLRLGEGAALAGGALVGPGMRVELLDGNAVLRLPERVVPLALQRGLGAALDGASVLVATDRAPVLTTHRAADAPWPAGARLVVGDAAAIEREALDDASTRLARMVGAGLAITSLALAALSFGGLV